MLLKWLNIPNDFGENDPDLIVLCVIWCFEWRRHECIIKSEDVNVENLGFWVSGLGLKSLILIYWYICDLGLGMYVSLNDWMIEWLN